MPDNKIIYAGELLQAIRDDPSINGANFAKVRRHIEAAKAVDAVPLSEIYRIIAGHSNYHGDNILSAVTCIAEGKEVNPVRPLEPTVDAVEVVHGRWITEKCDHVPWRIKNPERWVIHKCSVCGYSNGRKHSNYCPNCGAKMDGGNEDG